MVMSNFYSCSSLVVCYELCRKLDILEFPVIGSPLQILKKADRCTGNSDPRLRRHFQNEVFRTKVSTNPSCDNIGKKWFR
jgi:hypothetical protein